MIADTEALRAPELFTACQRCHENGEYECCHRLADIRWGGEMWCCEECWNPDEADQWATAKPAIASQDAELIRLRAEVERMRWQPIETAPRDGTSFIAFRPTMWGGKGHIGPTSWVDDRYAKKPRPFWQSVEHWIGILEDRQHPPTHWQPIPAAPEVQP